MEQRIDDGLSPYRIFSRAQWAALRDDTPMTLEPGEFERLRSMHDRLDLQEVEDIYLPLSRLLAPGRAAGPVGLAGHTARYGPTPSGLRQRQRGGADPRGRLVAVGQRREPAREKPRPSARFAFVPSAPNDIEPM